MTFTTIIKAQPGFKVRKKQQCSNKNYCESKINVGIKVFILAYHTLLMICKGYFTYTHLYLSLCKVLVADECNPTDVKFAMHCPLG